MTATPAWETWIIPDADHLALATALPLAELNALVTYHWPFGDAATNQVSRLHLRPEPLAE